MGLFRLLLIGFAIYAVYMLVRRIGTGKPEKSDANQVSYSDTVRCAHCGLHLPRDRAVRSRDGHYYCSPEHRDANQS